MTAEQLERAAILLRDSLLGDAQRADVPSVVQQRDPDPTHARRASDDGLGDELVSIEDVHRRTVGVRQLPRAFGDQLRRGLELELGGCDLSLDLHDARQPRVLVLQADLGEVARGDVLDHHERRSTGLPRPRVCRRDVAVDPDRTAGVVDQPEVEPVGADLAVEQAAGRWKRPAGTSSGCV